MRTSPLRLSLCPREVMASLSQAYTRIRYPRILPSGCASKIALMLLLQQRSHILRGNAGAVSKTLLQSTE